jgi:hypothetical protein
MGSGKLPFLRNPFHWKEVLKLWCGIDDELSETTMAAFTPCQNVNAGSAGGQIAPGELGKCKTVLTALQP